MAKVLKKIGKLLEKPFRTGRTAAKRASDAAEAERKLSVQERLELQAKRKKERQKASRIKLSGLKAKRSSPYHATVNEGRKTIG